MCLLPVALQRYAFEYWNISSFVIIVGVVVLYTALGIKARTAFKLGGGGANSAVKKNARLVKSVVTIACVYVFAWVTPVGVVLVLKIMNVSFATFTKVADLMGIFAVTNGSVNGYIYYLRSQEYRLAMRKALHLNNNEVEPFELNPTEDINQT